MNILQILPQLNFGGVETGTIDLAKRLIRLGHKCVIISGGGRQKEALSKFGIIHYELPVHKKSPLSILYSIKKVREIIKEERISLVHARSRVPAIIGGIASYMEEVSFITTCHGYYSKHIFSYPMTWGKIVIVISNSIGRHMVDDFRFPIDRMRLISRGVDLEQFSFREPSPREKGAFTPLEKVTAGIKSPSAHTSRPDTKEFSNGVKERSSLTGFTIGMIGRITPLKGHRFFIRSLVTVLKVMPNIKVLIVGDAPQTKKKFKEELKSLIARLELDRNIEFAGDTDDVAGVMSKLDLLVLATTSREGFGRVIIEAFASGVPVVATSVGGVLDIVINGKNGILVPPEDPGAMAEAILKILKNDKLRFSLIKEARKVVQAKFNLDNMVKETLSVYEEAVSIKRILVIKISSVGDVILAIPSLRAIKEKFPNSKLYVLVGIESRQIAQSCPYVDEVIVFDKGNDKFLFRLFKTAGELSACKFDIVIDLQNNKTSHLLSFLCWAPSRYGFDNGKFSFLLNHRVRFVGLGAIGPVEHQSKVLGMLGIDIKDDSLQLWPGEGDFKYIDEQLSMEWVSKEQPLVGMNLSSSAKWQTKRWPLENFIRLSEALAKENVRTVLTGTKEDENLAKKFVSVSKSKPINLVGKTSLLELASLIKRCDIFITADSAPMHIAAGIQTPFIALFGPTDPQRHLPTAKDFVLMKKDLKCMPCYKRKCINPKCMNEITPEEVLNVIKEKIVIRK